VVLDAHGRPALAVCDQLIPLSRSAPPAQPDQRLTAGIRPEALGIPAGDSTDGCLSTTIEQVEYLGHETLAYVRVGRSSADGAVHLVARLHGMRRFAAEETVRLHIDAERVHLFDEDGTASRAQ
jgi:ABC-type sugar transport system ATPase subunit